jgi:ADP-heptose:LPS heptosyltransferase
MFQLSGHKVVRIDKGRKEKKELTRKENKQYRQLTPMHQRYAEVFRDLGFETIPAETVKGISKLEIPPALAAVFAPGKPVIGVAPFAQYKEKMYPLNKMKAVVQQLAAANYIVLLFGGGKKEAAILQEWEQDIFSVFNLASRYSLRDELAIISNLNLMVSMDSANMHFASMYKVPVVSVWGATHPFAGFYGWGQDMDNAAQVDLYCRPCSVFGNKPCYRGDHACMNQLPEDLIIRKVNRLVKNGASATTSI